jgi:hypothetical protein
MSRSIFIKNYVIRHRKCITFNALLNILTAPSRTTTKNLNDITDYQIWVYNFVYSVLTDLNVKFSVKNS